MHLNTYYKPPVLCMQLSFYLFVLFFLFCCCCLLLAVLLFGDLPDSYSIHKKPSVPPIKNESIRQPQYH